MFDDRCYGRKGLMRDQSTFYYMTLFTGNSDVKIFINAYLSRGNINIVHAHAVCATSAFSVRMLRVAFNVVLL